MKLFRIISLILVITFSFNFTLAQEKEEDLTHGINIYLFDGYAAGYRFNESGNTFWRLNLDLYAHYTDGISNSDNQSIFFSGGDTSSYKVNNKDNNLSITLTPQYLYKFYQNKFVDFYTGGGILIGYNRHELRSENRYISDNPGYSYQYSILNGYSVGIIGILGLEGKLTENFSVFVESQLSETRTWSTSSSNSANNSEGTEIYRSYNSGKSKNWYTNFVLSRAGIIFRF